MLHACSQTGKREKGEERKIQNKRKNNCRTECQWSQKEEPGEEAEAIALESCDNTRFDETEEICWTMGLGGDILSYVKSILKLYTGQVNQ